jgi:serine/threonine protein kinase
MPQLHGDYQPAVGDFGLARLSFHDNTIITATAGTYYWQAPEVLGEVNTKYNYKVDVYAFGIVLWELLSGKVSTHYCFSQKTYTDWFMFVCSSPVTSCPLRECRCCKLRSV